MKIAKTAAKNWGQAEPQNLEEAKGITWGSEISSIKGIVKVLGLSTEMEEKMMQDVYESDTISPEIAKEIQKRIIGITGTANPNIIKMLSTVHDEWVRNNPNNFMKETEKGRRNKEYQFVPLELLSWKEAKSDLLFLKPILEASGIDIDEKQVEEQFEIAQKEFLIEHRIVSRENLRENLQSGSKFYPALEGLETKFGGNIENLLRDQTILEDMVSQVEKQVPIKSREELAKEIIASENPRYDEVIWLGTGISQPEIKLSNNPISEREVILSKLIGYPYSQDFLSIQHHPAFGPYSRALKGKYGHEQEIDEYETAMIKRKQEAGKNPEKDKKGFIEYGGHGKKKSIVINELELRKAGLDPKEFEWKSLEQVKDVLLSQQEATEFFYMKSKYDGVTGRRVFSQKEKELIEQGILATPTREETYDVGPSWADAYSTRTVPCKLEELSFEQPEQKPPLLESPSSDRIYQLEKIEERKRAIEAIKKSKDKKIDQLGRIVVPISDGSNIEIEVTPRQLAEAGIYYEDYGYRSLKDIKKEIAEADKETGLTTTDVGGIKALINKMREKFKGKGEKE